MPLDKLGDLKRVGWFGVLLDQWTSFLRRAASRADVKNLPKEEIERVARDLSVSSSDLIMVAEAGDRVTPLVAHRLEAAGCSAESLQETHPAVLRDIVKVCAACSSKSACESELAATGRLDEAIRQCPNTSTIAALAPHREAAPSPVESVRAWPMCC